MSGYSHTTVLLHEAVDALAIRADGVYIDGTFGRGGHSAEILKRLGPKGRLVAIDRDPQAIAEGERRFADDARFCLVRGAFSELPELLARCGVTGPVDGLLLDLGVSSPQLDDAERGFSFMRPGPLDMRMDPDRGVSAAQWLEQAEESEIADVLYQYGEERQSRRIARAIKAALPIARTEELAEVVAQALPRHEKNKHPATRTFQAIRIFINRELDELQAVLQHSLHWLAAGARLVVISFHSLEDRMVKRFLREGAQGERLPKGVPVQGEPRNRLWRLIGKAVRAGDAEVSGNARARSAVMRVAERLA